MENRWNNYIELEGNYVENLKNVTPNIFQGEVHIIQPWYIKQRLNIEIQDTCKKSCNVKHVIYSFIVHFQYFGGE